MHQIAGYDTVFWVMMYAVVYSTAWSKPDSLHEFQKTSYVMGIVMGFSMLTILDISSYSASSVTRFAILDIVMFMLILITVGMHRPKFSTRTVVMVIFTACMWITDRALRFSKVSLFTFGNIASVTPLPYGGTRIVLRKSPAHAKPGTHCFIWIPAVQKTETHPFTVISSEKSTLSFVIAAYDGPTRDLHNYGIYIV